MIKREKGLTKKQAAQKFFWMRELKSFEGQCRSFEEKVQKNLAMMRSIRQIHP